MEYEIVSSNYPTTVELETTSRCNINPPCPMCARALRDVSDEHNMSASTVLSCSGVIYHCDTLSMFGIGEPLLDPRFGSFVSGKSNGRLVFLSNGQIMTEKHIDIILSRPVDSIMFSLDAASPQTYCKIRGYDLHTFDKVISNIRSLMDSRGSRSLNLPIVRLGFVMMVENFHEIPSFVELAHFLGVDGVSFWPLNHYGNVPEISRNGWVYREEDQILSNVPKTHMESTFVLCNSLAEKYGLFLEWRNER